MPIALIAAGITAAGAIGSSVIASNAAKDATKAQVNAADQATQLQRDIYTQNRTDQAPWREAGVAALGQISQLIGPGGDPSAWLKSQPGYQFGLDTGVNALDRSATARGGVFSGGAAKALTRYGQDYGSTKFGEAFNRLASVAGIGQTATNATQLSGQNYANQAGLQATNAGNAIAQGAQNQSGIATGTIGTLAGLGSNLFGQYGGSSSSYTPMPTQSINTNAFATQPVASNANFVNPLPTQVYG